jgi:hypothetical protein
LEEFEIKLNSLKSTSESPSALRGGDNYHEFFVKSGLLRTNHGVTDGRDLDWHGLMGAGII